MVQGQEKPRRRSSTGPNRRPSERQVVKNESTGFDPFDASNTESVNSLIEKKNEIEWPTDSDQIFDPFIVDTKEKVEKNKKKTEKDPKGRRTPGRSNSVGTLSLSKADFGSPESEKNEKNDDDMEFEAIDWDTTTESPPKRSSKGKSRRHSMDSRPSKGGTENDSEENLFEKYSEELNADEAKKKKKLRSAKTRRQSLDSALSSPLDDSTEDEDGFGPVKTYGFEPPANSASSGSDRRRGMTRSKSGSTDTTMNSFRPGDDPSRAPKRGINRRRSENPVGKDNDGFHVKSMDDYAYETETTATPDSQDD